jgi:cobalt-zinc-cadmium efflux system protein
LNPGGHTAHVHRTRSGGVDAGAGRRRLALALGLIVALMTGEILGGVLGGSLALLSDASHMLTDAAGLGLALFAVSLAARPARGAMTYGWRRIEILSAQVNGAVLLALAGAIVYSAVRRLISPGPVSGGTMVVIALAGILVTGLATHLLAGAGRESLNIEGAFQHTLTDLFAFLGTAIAGGVILATGFRRADPLASLVVVGLLLRAGYGLLRESARVVLEAAPRGIDPNQIGRTLAAQEGVVEVHDLHVWELSAGFVSLSAHVLVASEADCHAVRRRLEELLHERFELDHTTLQVDHERPAELIELQVRPPARG